MHDRTPWTRGRTGDFQLPTRSGKMKTYNNLTEFTRPCLTCGQPFSIHVTGKIAAGEADSNSFGLKNCEEHRRARTTDDTLRMSNTVMKEELAGLYSRVQEQFAEIQQLKARLAVYELQPAMEAQANGLTHKMPWE
jgi:hypothetical protein